MCRSCMASEASLILKAALQPCLVMGVSADEVTTATPDIYSGSPQEDTHIQTQAPTRAHTLTQEAFYLLPWACQVQRMQSSSPVDQQ